MPLSRSDAAHLLRRTGFGATEAAVNELVAIGSRQGAVDRVLDVKRAPAIGLPPIGESRQLDENAAFSSAAGWWLDRMRNSQVPIVEKMTLFWHGHFVSSRLKVGDMGLLFRQNQLLRRMALGSFHDLVQAVSFDPAMLYYLDNWENISGRPQENFGRELMELFTMGRGTFDEADVVSMSRAWTGHNLTDDRRAYKFRGERHDNGSKVLFGLPPRNWNAPDTISEILLGARAVESSRFITAKLYTFLSRPIGVDDPLVHALADQFRSSGLSIYSLVRSILLTDDFWSPTARLALVRSPIEWYIAAVQATSLPARTVDVSYWMSSMGQVLFDPPTVAGWPGGRSWISTSIAATRLDVAEAIRVATIKQPAYNGTNDFGSPADRVAAAFTQFGILDPSPATTARLTEFVVGARARGEARNLVADLAVVVLTSPDFQLA